ncbi:hypothetical protein SAMN02910298_01746 [Pseudobutyrivibrio sp. YE44]|uniref:hypothetical protein n=1 Tax=Pseudobutyrivibrio sp. YE44 TaxID=1520802 RepID=UPI00088E1B3F|nr:hypothetical protein [Pseudobutyrivibrio sp. YE44]SDB35418.1 hypothetical protein SAMN02910298_01746 [Pseudobutyrivibrio sp. YE44]
MKKTFILSLCCLLIASSLIACGGDKSADDSEIITSENGSSEEPSSEDATEKDADIITATVSDGASEDSSDTSEASTGETNLSLDVKFAVLAYQHIARCQSVLVVSEVTNSSDRDYDISNGFNQELVATATQNGVPLETLRLGSDSIRDPLKAGSTMLIMDGFKTETPDDITVTWYENGVEIATKTYTTNELVQTSQDYLDGKFDTSAYDEQFLFLSKDIKKIIDDINP